MWFQTRNSATSTVRPAAGHPSVVGAVIEPRRTLPSGVSSMRAVELERRRLTPTTDGRVAADCATRNDTRDASTTPSTSFTPAVDPGRATRTGPASSAARIARASSTGRGVWTITGRDGAPITAP